ncbi:hypothetical protein F4777DRAFT_555422 [Nemania sp. FL0916]|nr:hypothetical protein F4777DRAFT_555422 [Nemania sp. FL0916]
MKRVQQDHGSSTSTSNSPSPSFPSVTANHPVLRSRRASDYPPLSHQTQIMKAVRRSAALPSLSLSIPSSPTQAATMRLDGPVDQFSLAKEEPSKTVTFSEPEDEELSDNSSICQSPSWEQYSQKKKKKTKKPVDQKGTKKQEDTSSKRRSNRLIKAVPIDQFAAKPLTASDRSLSAPNLGISTLANKMNSPLLTAEAQVALGKHQTPRNGQGLIAKDKPKSRGFLSGLRLQHGNAKKGPEKDVGADAEKGVDENEPLRSIQYEKIPVQPLGTLQPGNSQTTSKSRRAPSIRSVISTSDHSLSSQEKKSSGARTPAGSSHARSQSLLSSTLNKLRGPSYLYYQPSGDGSISDASKYTNGSPDINPINDDDLEIPTERAGTSLGERSLADPEQPPRSLALPPQPRRVNTEPGPDIAPRGRQPRHHKVDARSPDVDLGGPVLRPAGGRRVQIEAPQVSTQDTVMALVTAQERQSRTTRASQQARSKAPKGKQESDQIIDYQSPEAQRNGVHRAASQQAVVVNPPNAERITEKAGNGATAGDGYGRDDDQASIGTYASTIRPLPSSQDGSFPESGKQPKISREEQLGEHSETAARKSVDDLITFERDVPDTLQQPLQPLQPHREVDYFASFSDSYLPPLLDLQFPDGSGLSPPKFPFTEESDEEGAHGFLHDNLTGVPVSKVVAAAERVRKTLQQASTPSVDLKPKASPAMSTQYSDSDVPAFDRLGISSKATNIKTRTEAAGMSTTHSQHTDPSRATSEGSSSSICDDTPPSPISVATPDSSRPQSRKGIPNSQPGHPQTATLNHEQTTHTVPRPDVADVRMRNSVEDGERFAGRDQARPLPPRAQSALDLHSNTKPGSPPSRPQRLHLKPNGVASSVSLPSSPPADLTEEVMPRKSALKMSRNNSSNGAESSTAISVGAAYLQEARKAAPVAAGSSSRALRPHFMHNSSSGSVRSALSTGNRADPIAKMLVECCNCHFFHDMPSRVYECMAKPDSVVEDKLLGVSAAITTMVRCPWCAHGMTTQCCSGFAAVVYLKEKLHGK